MGFFYPAMERAEGTEPEAERAKSGAPATPAPAAATTPVLTWQEAEQRDFAGYPLEAAAAEPEWSAQADWNGASQAMAGEAMPASLTVPQPHDPVSLEQFRILRTRVLEALGARQLRALLVTSPGAGDGKTTVAAQLAMQCSSLHQGRVLLVDADLRRAGLSELVRPRPMAGLAQCLKGDHNFEALVQKIDPWLSVLPTASVHAEATELLSSQRMVELLDQSRAQYDLVILDSAPVGPVVDSRVLARLTGAALLVVRSGVTPADEVGKAAAMLRPGLIGTVLNGARLPRFNKYHYAYTPVIAAGSGVRP